MITDRRGKTGPITFIFFYKVSIIIFSYLKVNLFRKTKMSMYGHSFAFLTYIGLVFYQSAVSIWMKDSFKILFSPEITMVKRYMWVEIWSRKLMKYYFL